MVKNIVITHGYSDSNKGDLAITQATIDGIRKNNPDANITLLSVYREDDPDFWYHNRKMKENHITIMQGILSTPYIGTESSFIINLLAVFRLLSDYLKLTVSLFSGFLGKYLGGKQYKALQKLKMADLVVIKGGQFIYNDREDLRGNLFLWRTLQPINVARKLNKKIVLMGQSIGGFASSKSEKTAIKYLKLCDKIVVRERLSYELLEKYSVKNVLLKPDTAFYINRKQTKLDFKQFTNKEVFGITVVNWSFPESPDADKAKKQYTDSLITVIENAFTRYDLFPVFIPQVTVRHHGKSDLDLINSITKILEQKKIPFYTVEEDFDAAEMVDIYSKCKLLIGTRLHSCILAANAATPVIAIRYQGYKTQGVMKMLGLENLVHDINNLEAEKLEKDLEFVIANHEQLHERVKQKVFKMRQELEEVFKDLF